MNEFKYVRYKLCLLPLWIFFIHSNIIATAQSVKKNPQILFAIQEVDAALKEVGRTDLQVVLSIKPNKNLSESYEIQVTKGKVIVIGSDANGAMYGGLEVAEYVKLGLPIITVKRSPFVKKRGVKFNIPLDARSPSYDDSGDAAQNNIQTVWDFKFWKAYLDDMARNRYNVLSLWNAHPYPSIIKVNEYPEVALDDVYRIGVDLKPEFKKSGKSGPWGSEGININKPGVLKLVKKMNIDEKISHWQQVFQYAGDRGIEIYLFHWNVFTFGATGKHGITNDQSNPITNNYLRKSVRQALLTYPQIKGIGVTAGENADNNIEGEYSIENFLFNTYGKAIMDVRKLQPDRKVRFIFRQHQSGLGPITTAFSDFPDEFDTSFKYAIGHMYSMRRPQLLEQRGFIKDIKEYKVNCWLNLRNDDIFVLRWGSPDFVREYIQRMPHDVIPGFYMGSDGYVWGREFISKNPEMAGKLEIDKHWYQFKQWGQLAYTPELGRDYWEATLKHRFPSVSAQLLYDAWAATSEIIPHVNTATFAPNDAEISPEGCIGFRGGFLTVDDYYLSPIFSPMVGSGIISIPDWAKAFAAQKIPEGITPLQVADQLDEYAGIAITDLLELRKQIGDNVELQETLNDIESMAYLGRYYADKMRGAAKLAVFREDIQQKQFNAQAVSHLKDAVDEWRSYAAIASSQYKTQLLARSDFLDWNSILKEVEKEVVSVRNEGDYPNICFTNLKDGLRLPIETDLRVLVEAIDRNGIREVKLYLNGLLLKSEANDLNSWSGSSDELLKMIKPGVYHLKAVAVDKTGTLGWREIEVVIGDISNNSSTNWRDEIHQVILNEGDVILDEDSIEFPRLECNLALNNDGRLVLYDRSSSKRKNEVWISFSRKDISEHHCVEFKNGRLAIYRGTPDQKEILLFKTPKVPGNRSYKLGITASKKLIIYNEVEKNKIEIVWTNNKGL
jgi:hypothetical protein